MISLHSDAALSQLRSSELRGAVAAERQAAASELQNYVGAAETLLLLITVMLSFAAARSASSAARSAEKSLQETRRIAELELRPYVYFSGCEIRLDKSLGWEAFLVCENFGSTPASRVKINVNLGISHGDCVTLGDLKPFEVNYLGKGMTLGVRIRLIEVFSNESEMSDFMSKRASLLVAAKLEYEFFGKMETSTNSVRIDSDSLQRGAADLVILEKEKQWVDQHMPD